MKTIASDLDVSERNLRDQGESENAIVPDSDRLTTSTDESNAASGSTSWSWGDMSTAQRKRRLDHHYSVSNI